MKDFLKYITKNITKSCYDDAIKQANFYDKG